MPSLNSISPDKLVRLIGMANCPRLIDVRPFTSIEARGVPGATFRSVSDLATNPVALAGQEAVIVCSDGVTDSPGVAALLRHHGCRARTMEGGFAAWESRGLPALDVSKVPNPFPAAGSVWVTRARPKVDRIACPWLIRRFVDPNAVFLFVLPAEIPDVVQRFGATPFDFDGAYWSHRGELCSFDVMVEEFGLASVEGLARLSVIVRGADTAKPDLAPQAAGLLAMSLGLSRMFSSDLEQLEAGMLLYDALYRWCRDAVEDTHDWVSHQPKKQATGSAH